MTPAEVLPVNFVKFVKTPTVLCRTFASGCFSTTPESSQNKKNIEAVIKRFSEKKKIDEIIKNSPRFFFMGMCKAKQVTGFYMKRNTQLVSI